MKEHLTNGAIESPPMTTQAERVLLLLKARGLGDREIRPALVKVCGVAYQSVKDWMTGDTQKIGAEHLAKIARHWNTSLEWLTDGTGRMDSNTGRPSATNPLQAVSSALLWDTGRDFAVSAATMLPVLSWSETRKMLLETGDRPPDVGAETQYSPSPFPTQKGDFFAKWEDDSMISPDGAGYRSGSHLHISPSEPHQSGDDVLVRMPGDRVIFRRLKESADGPILEALNPAWPDRIIAMPDDARVLAVVVGSTYRNRR